MSIEDQFENYFANWQIKAPTDQRGVIKEAGWSIRYLFSSDQLGSYMDIYASHRMTNDRHLRFRDDLELEHLPAINTMYLGSFDPDRAKQLEAENSDRNVKIYKVLKDKGFKP